MFELRVFHRRSISISDLMLRYYESLFRYLQGHQHDHWVAQLRQQIPDSLNTKRYGDLSKWRQALNSLPNIKPSYVELVETIDIGRAKDLDPQQHQVIQSALQALIPWRKGPFTIFDIHINSEWRSDWKWKRILPHIQDLYSRRVLDVGCGNGYHPLRMLGAGAECVIGVDPSPRFIVQFLMIKQFLDDRSVHVLPLTLEQLPASLAYFDTTFSMGVLYHRRSPLEHLQALKKTLKPGGQLVLETLVIDGKFGEVLIPEDRYSMMRNIWCIPSAPTLIGWLKECGFNDPQLVDLNQTSTEEQRSTEWMPFHSLADFLDPENHQLTREGHPAPLRGLFVANAP
ncbi:MAG: tRNA (mo5U34)-methyltransferase [Cellvibrionaceae bacterium]